MEATFIERMANAPGSARFRLSQPLNGWRYVIVAAERFEGLPERTRIFAAKDSGPAMWEKPDGYLREFAGQYSWAEALAREGYEVLGLEWC